MRQQGLWAAGFAAVWEEGILWGFLPKLVLRWSGSSFLPETQLVFRGVAEAGGVCALSLLTDFL